MFCHAIGAAKIAAVCHRDAQVRNGAGEWVDQGGCHAGMVGAKWRGEKPDQPNCANIPSAVSIAAGGAVKHLAAHQASHQINHQLRRLAALVKKGVQLDKV